MKIVREGWPLIIWESVMGVIALWSASQAHTQAFATIFGMISGFAFLLAAFCAYFFRDPARVIPKGEKFLLAPADGKILEVIEGKDAISSGPVWILRIFLSVFEPHLQRSPVAGQVQAIRYTKGKFLDARDPKAPFENEQNRIE